MSHGPVSKKSLFSYTGGWQFVSQHITLASLDLLLQNQTAFVLLKKASDIWQIPGGKNHHLKFIFSLGFFIGGLFSCACGL